jgi:hypothetical protein
MLDPDILGRLEGLDREKLAALFAYMLGPTYAGPTLSKAIAAKEKPPARTGGAMQSESRA